MKILNDNFQLTSDNLQLALPYGQEGEACQFSSLVPPGKSNGVTLLFFYASDDKHSQMMCFGVNNGHLKMYSYGVNENGLCLTPRVTRFLVWIANIFLSSGDLPSRAEIEALDLAEVLQSEFPKDIDTDL